MEPAADSESPIKLFFGPITVDEIRKVLSQKKSPAQIGRRASISDVNPSRTIYGDTMAADLLMKEKFFKQNFDRCISFVSEYFTPNENLHSGKAATELIYKTACTTPANSSKVNDTRLCNFEHNMDFPVNNVSAENSKNSFIEKLSKALEFTTINVAQQEYSSNKNVSGLSFINSGKKVRSSQFLDRATDTILISSDEENYDAILESSNKSNISEVCDYSVIVISDDDDDDSDSHKRCIYREDIKTESFSDVEESQCNLYKNKYSIDSNFVILKDKVSENLRVNEHLDATFSGISTKLQDNNATGIVYEKEAYANISDNVTQNSESLNLSNNGNLNSNDLELSAQSEFKFRDTLEEIEMFLQKGEDYTISEESDDSYHNLQPSEISKSNINIPVFNLASSVNENTETTSTPIKKPYSGTITSLKVNKPSRVVMKENFNFKTPLKVGVSHKTNNFKNILSPVGVYIRNSPRVPQLQHTCKKPLPKSNLIPERSFKKGNKENDAEALPNCLYKPAKQTCMSKAKELKLPGNIQKHIPNIPVIVKHQGRLRDNPLDITDIDEKLEGAEENLTAYFDNSTTSNLMQDTSVLISKKAYIK